MPITGLVKRTRHGTFGGTRTSARGVRGLGVKKRGASWVRQCRGILYDCVGSCVVSLPVTSPRLPSPLIPVVRFRLSKVAHRALILMDNLWVGYCPFSPSTFLGWSLDCLPGSSWARTPCSTVCALTGAHRCSQLHSYAPLLSEAWFVSAIQIQ